MKKVVFLGSIIISGAVFAANSSEAVSGANDFNGVYVGAGVDFSHVANKANVTWVSFNPERPEISHKKENLFGASTVIGYGHVFSNNIYVGGEFLVDISNDKKFNGNYTWGPRTVSYNGKIKGIVPSIAVRLGYYVNSLGTTFYGRAGAAHVKLDFYDGTVDGIRAGNPNTERYGQRHDISKIVPVLGIGVEKKFGAFGVRFEGDCRFIASKDATTGAIANGQNVSLKVRNRVNSYVARLMVTYNFR